MSDHIWLMRRGALGLILAMLLTVVFAGPAAGLQRERDADCSLPPTGKIPLTDLGADLYVGSQGGLYPEGSNTVPDSHLAVGLARAAQITPRDASGAPDPNGKVVFASIGFSNPHHEFAAFIDVAQGATNLDASFVPVNLAQGGQHVLVWGSPNGLPWENIPLFLDSAGVTAQQVQAVWLKQTQRKGTVPDSPFPDNAIFLRDRIAEVLPLLQQTFPNLHVAYVSSRSYGGYNDVSSVSPEPIAFEEGFAVKWLIEEQIAGNPALNADPAAGEIMAPWLAWGPYLWADGINPRSDGVSWECGEFRGIDGTHLSDRGNTKVANMLIEFLRAEPTAAWAFADRELPDSPENAVPPPTSTIPGASDTTATTEAPDGRRGRERRARDATTTTAAPEVDDTTAAAAPATTAPPRAEAARPPARQDETLPPLVWALIGAGAMLVVMGSGLALMRMRRATGSGADEGGEPPSQ